MGNKIKNILVLVVALISLLGSLGYAQEFSEDVWLAQLMDQLLDESNYNLYEDTLSMIFQSGDEITPLLLERFNADLKNLGEENIWNYWAVDRLTHALILLGDVEPVELLDPLFEYSNRTLLVTTIKDICLYVPDIGDSRCNKFLSDSFRPIHEPIIAIGLSGREENLQYLDVQQDQIKKIQKLQPNAGHLKRLALIVEGAKDWIKRGGAQFTQPAGMPDEEAVWQLIIEFLGAFERKIPWLILKESEKGKPVKPHHQVSYYQVEKEEFTPEGREGRIWQTRQLLSPHGVESRRPVWKIIAKIKDQEKMVPIEILSDDMIFSPDRTRVLVRIEYRDHDWGNISGYTFLFRKIDGQWQFRFSEGKVLIEF